MKCKWLLGLLVAAPGFACATDGDFDSNGVKIHYVTEGEGDAIVLIHGWMSDSSMWGQDSAGNTKLDTRGAPGFKLIAFDCRGHGKSGKPHDQSMYGAEMAADVVRLLNHLKIKKAHLVGYSMGAFIAGKVAATNPERVESLIFGGQAPLIKGVPASGGNEVEVFAKAVDAGKGLGPYLLEVMPGAKAKMTLEQANNLAAFAYKGKDVKAFAASGLSLGDLRVAPEDLGKCKAPCLFIYGEKESDATKRSVDAARKILKNSSLKVVPGGDHITTLVKPEFGASVVAFLLAHRAK